MWRGRDAMEANVCPAPAWCGLAGLSHGKMVIYRSAPQASTAATRPTGCRDRKRRLSQARLETGWAPRSEDSISAFADWHFDWLGWPAFIAAADQRAGNFRWSDQRPPLLRWSFGRVTLLGDAPIRWGFPRAFQSAGQAILDARALVLGAARE